MSVANSSYRNLVRTAEGPDNPEVWNTNAGTMAWKRFTLRFMSLIPMEKELQRRKFWIFHVASCIILLGERAWSVPLTYPSEQISMPPVNLFDSVAF